MKDTGTARRTFPSEPEALAEAREFVRRHAWAAGLSRAATDDLILAVSEASTNAVLHSGSEEFEVEWRDGATAVEVEVRDHGRFRRRVRMTEVEGPGGFGIPLMTALTDGVEISEGTASDPGTKVRIRKRRS